MVIASYVSEIKIHSRVFILLLVKIHQNGTFSIDVWSLRLRYNTSKFTVDFSQCRWGEKPTLVHLWQMYGHRVSGITNRNRLFSVRLGKVNKNVILNLIVRSLRLKRQKYKFSSTVGFSQCDRKKKHTKMLHSLYTYKYTITATTI